MKTHMLTTLLVVLPGLLFAQGGKDLFTQNCAACHSVGKGKLVGPDLRGVETRHPTAWLYKWIKSSQTMVTNGDKVAVKLFADNSSIPMPDQALTSDQVKSILDYIKGEGIGNSVDNATQPTPVITASSGNASSVPKNSGFDPLVMSGTPAVFGQVKMQQDSRDIWQGNKWFLFITIASLLVILSTSVVFANINEGEEPVSQD
jgi:cytochrome c551/c552